MLLEIINTIILAITAWIVRRYTRAAQRSNDIQERPILNLYLRENRTGSNIVRTLKLKNVGNGPAYNISFAGIKADGYVYYPYFDEPNPILERDGDDKIVKLWVATPDGGVETYEPMGFELFLKRLFKKEVIKKGQYNKVARSACIFLVSYKAVSGKNYYSIFRIYSKIAPLLPVYDLVVEFIDNRQGQIDIATAKNLCDMKPIMLKND